MLMSGENLNGKLICPLQQNNRNKHQTLPDNTIHYSTRQFHRVRSYDNAPTPMEQQQKRTLTSPVNIWYPIAPKITRW